MISVALHMVFFGCLLSTMSFTEKKPQVTVNLQINPDPDGDKQKIVKASLIDKKAVDAALQRQANAAAEEQHRQKVVQEQLLAQERKAEKLKQEAEVARQALETANAQKLKLEAANKRAAADKLKLEQEQQQIKKQIAQQQAQAKRDSEKKDLAKQDLAKKEQQKKDLAAKQAAQGAAKASAQRAQEDAKLAAIKAQQDKLAAEHLEFMLEEVDKYRAAFQTVIEDNRILSSVFTGAISCKIRIRLLPDGSIASVSVVESSGNPAYDDMSTAAVYKSAPFPMPQDQELYAQLRDVVLSFRNGDQASDAI